MFNENAFIDLKDSKGNSNFNSQGLPKINSRSLNQNYELGKNINFRTH